MTVSASLLNNQLLLTHETKSYYILSAAIAKKIQNQCRNYLASGVKMNCKSCPSISSPKKKVDS
jgi:hypothetical protein